MLRMRKELIQARSKVADLQEELEEKTRLYLNAIQVSASPFRASRGCAIMAPFEFKIYLSCLCAVEEPADGATHAHQQTDWDDR